MHRPSVAVLSPFMYGITDARLEEAASKASRANRLLLWFKQDPLPSRWLSLIPCRRLVTFTAMNSLVASGCDHMCTYESYPLHHRKSACRHNPPTIPLRLVRTLHIDPSIMHVKRGVRMQRGSTWWGRNAKRGGTGGKLSYHEKIEKLPKSNHVRLFMGRQPQRS